MSEGQDEFEVFQQEQEARCGDKGMGETGDMMKVITRLLEQNAALLNTLKDNQIREQTPVNNDEIRNFNIMPDLSKSIETFNAEKGPKDAADWLRRLETTGRLHSWPEAIMFETARGHLVGAAKHWYQGRSKELKDWNDFKAAFKKTFLLEKSKTELWKCMQFRRQQRRESIHSYFHEKVSLCRELNLPFSEIKEQVVVGFWSRDMSNYIMARQDTDEDDLYKVIVVYERVDSVRRGAVMDQIRGKKEEATTEVNIRDIKKDPKIEKDRKAVKCFNCGGPGHVATTCTKPKKPKGSCFQCGSQEHQVKDCGRASVSKIGDSSMQKNSENSVNFVETVPSYKVEVDLVRDHETISIIPIIDTGSPISLIVEHLVPCKLINYEIPSQTFQDINRSVVKIIGGFDTTLTVQKFECQVNFYVVPQETLNYTCLLGRDFIINNKLDVTFSRAIKVSREDIANDCNFIFQIDIANENGREDIANDCNFIFQIDIANENDVVLDIDDNINPYVKQNFLTNFKQRYMNAERPSEPDTKFEMKINTKPNHVPFFFGHRRISFSEKEQLNKIIEDLLTRGIIRRSTSEYSSPIVLVAKKPSGIRLCVDYRELNKITIRDNFPLPLIDDQIDRLRGKSVYTRLDLRDAFHHVSIHPNSVKYTSFITHSGQFEYLKMPFGLKNSPASFCRYINLIFRDLIEQNKVCTYIDDILVATETLEQNIDILNEVFEILVKNRLELKVEKCSFFKREIQFLGYTVNSAGVRPCKSNIETVTAFPVPKCFKDVQSFLGLASYFRRFVPNYAVIAKPLYELLLNEPTLAIYIPKAETQLHCDASAHGYGSILLQKQEGGKFHPVFYFSKRTTPAESKFHSYELEMLRIVYALQRFRVYLQGIEFKIITDCNSVRLALLKKEINAKILRWSLELQNYCYTMEHRSNKQMTHVDCLSRICVLILEDNSFERNLSIKQDQDVEIGKIRELLDHSEDKLFELRNGLVYRKFCQKSLFFVPKCMEQNIIRTYHDEVGHVGVGKTMELIQYHDEVGHVGVGKTMEYSESKRLEANGIRHSLIATGTPRANGQAEIVNKMLTNICSKLAENTSKWDEVLDQVEFAINNTLNRSTGQTPSMLLFGINQRGRIQDNLREYLEAQNETDRNLESIRQKSAENIVKNQEYNKPSHIYKIGDYVMVVNTDVTPGVSKKLIPKYRGPYMVTAVLDNDRYVVKDIPGFEVTQIPFEGIMAPSRMRPWLQENDVFHQNISPDMIGNNHLSERPKL
ncbi:Retrotransposon gag protein [Popillia japonica]|uniref:RNA-directed DNA polymerase n=1 Tax=Popillia japonica TaxID=7064 RepID=A0AAW1JC34_POPJA